MENWSLFGFARKELTWEAKNAPNSDTIVRTTLDCKSKIILTPKFMY